LDKDHLRQGYSDKLMWRLLDLRVGKYISVIELTHPNDWGLYECLTTYFERRVVDNSYDFIRKTFPTNTPQSTIDKQEIIEQVIPIEFLQELVGSNWIDRYQQDVVRLYLDECLTETFPEYTSKKKALLAMHRWIGTKARYFYEAVDMEIQDG
jgi:hypothetical protein